MAFGKVPSIEGAEVGVKLEVPPELLMGPPPCPQEAVPP